MSLPGFDSAYRRSLQTVGVYTDCPWPPYPRDFGNGHTAILKGFVDLFGRNDNYGMQRAIAENGKTGMLEVHSSYPKEKEMKKQLLALAVLFLGASINSAAQQPTAATIISEKSVDCGTKKEGKKESTDLLCQQYTVRTTTTEYQIRQQKPSDKVILPANTPIEFTLNKDKMKFKVNGKKYEYLVVGTSAIGSPTK